MIVISAYATPEFIEPADVLMRRLERAGRTSYKSEARITDTSAGPFIRGIVKAGHESVIEHAIISAVGVFDRGVSHELVRHRIASYTQESTRYCNYNKTGAVTFIKPCFWSEQSVMYSLWQESCAQAENTYLSMIRSGEPAQHARSVLPNSLKTEVYMTLNLRAWRHFFHERCANGAHPQMREFSRPLLLAFKDYLPVIFEDLNYPPTWVNPTA